MKNLLITVAVIASILLAHAIPNLIVDSLPNWALDALGYGFLLSILAGLIYLIVKLVRNV